MDKIALITGANRGIGYETARQLGLQGVHPIVAARTQEKADAAVEKLAAQGIKATAVQLDVVDAADREAAARKVEEQFGRLDILINNAAIMIDDPARLPSEQSLEAWKETFETNVFAVVAVTQAFLPLLKKSAAGRIVNLSSSLGSLTLHSDPRSNIYTTKLPAYCVSKTAINGWTVQLAYELRDTPIKVNAVHPGWVKTEMGGEQAPMELEDGARTSVRLALLPDDGPTGSYFHMDETLPW